MERLERREFLRRVGAAGAAMVMPVGARAAGSGGERLNVVIIVIDDLGWADLGCYGSKYHETPNIDLLAREGMRLTEAYAACPVCSPTRASLVTGQYPARLHLTDFLVGTRWPANSPIAPVDWQKGLPPSEMTLARVLKSAGYVTGHIGKWHLGGEHEVEEFGFDENVAGGQWGTAPSYFSPYKNSKLKDGPEGEYLTDRLAAEAERFIEQNRDRPFFLNLCHYAVHIPLRAKAELIAKYEGKGKPAGRVVDPVYAAMTESVDQCVGRVMRKLEELGIADRTVVMLMSDNGGLSVREGGWQPTSNAPLRAGKGFLYEGGVRVPWIVRWPGVVRRGSVCNEPVCSIDVLPTILEATGVQRPAGGIVDGCSIIPLLRGRSRLNRIALYWHYPHYSNQGGRPGGAVRCGDYKLIEWYENGAMELYNLREDLGERRNLVGSMTEKAEELRGMLRQWRAEVGAQMPGRRGGGR
ncbi:MAG: sulfatase [Bacillota bacterium]